MKNQKLENMVLALAVFLVLGIFAFTIHVRPTADQVTVMKATGVNCGVIADIEKGLYAKRGVVTVEVNPNDGKVIVGYESKTIQPQTIAAVIAEMGHEITVLETLGVETFRVKTGMGRGADTFAVGCGGLCGVRK